MTSGAWLLMVVTLPLYAMALALIWRHRPWDTRLVPSDAFRLVTGVCFAAWVEPAFGLLALVSAGWWANRGWERVAGGTFWPMLAMGVLLGKQADGRVVSAALALVIAMGVVQTAVAAWQHWGNHTLFVAHEPHGTLGHRTGLGIYLAMALCLGFLTDYGWIFLAVYAIGLYIAKSATATAGAMAGFLWLHPWAIGFVLVLALVGFWRRLVEWSPSESGKLYHMANVRSTWNARLAVWRNTLASCRRWPHWLIGYGAESYAEHARTWVGRPGIVEVFAEAHQDYLEYLFEYGLVGLAAFGVWLVTYGSGFGLFDPITAGLLALGVAMLANFPMRVGPLASVGVLLLLVVMRRVG